MSYKWIIIFNLILSWFIYSLYFNGSLILFLYFSIFLFCIYFFFRRYYQYILIFIFLMSIVWILQVYWLDFFANSFNPVVNWWIRNDEFYISTTIIFISLLSFLINVSIIIVSFYEKKEELKNNQNLEWTLKRTKFED